MQKNTWQGWNRAERLFIRGLLTTGRPTVRLYTRHQQRSCRVQPRTRNEEYVFRRLVHNGLFTNDGYITPRGAILARNL